MLRVTTLALAIFSLASPALAAHCTQPFAPDMAITAKSTKQDILQIRADVQSFITASDVYQQCIVDAGKTDPVIGGKSDSLVSASQKEKQRVGDAFNAAVKAFNNSQVASN